MTLPELTDPLFQYVCRLNRLAKNKGNADYAVVRAEVKATFEEMQQKASADGRLASQFKKMELPLLFFVDSMISESKLSFAAQWNQNRLAYDRNELAGDEKFFDLLDEAMKDPGEEASERLAVFYVCIGLGFSGIYFRQPEYLRKTMLTIAPRIRHLVETDQTAKICPETYEGVDTRDLVQPPSGRLIYVAMLFLCCTLALAASYFVVYRQASNNLKKSLQAILEQESK